MLREWDVRKKANALWAKLIIDVNTRTKTNDESSGEGVSFIVFTLIQII